MAIQGKFIADFSQFHAAVTEAASGLEKFGYNVDKLKDRTTGMFDKLSGRKVIEEASIMAAAIDKLGGVATLTEKELAKVGRTMNEAVEKMKLTGETVPANMQRIADATKDATTKTTDWAGALTKAASVFGIAFSAQAVLGFARSVIATADDINTMSESLGVSAEAVQRWGYAFSQSGGSMTTAQSGIQNMSKALGEGSPGLKQALAAVGLEFEAFRALSVEEQFNKATQALHETDNAATRATAGAALFGGAWKEIQAGVVAGVQKVGAETAAMSDQTVDALAAAEAKWKWFKDQLVVHSAEIAAATLKVPGIIKEAGSSLEGIATFLENARVGGIGYAIAMAGVVQEVKKATEAQTDFNNLPRTIMPGPTAAELDAQAKALEKWTKSAEYMAALMAGPDGMSAATKEGIKWLLELGASAEQVATYFDVNAAAVKSVATEMETAKAIAKSFGELWKDVSSQNMDWTNKQGAALQTLITKFDQLATAEMNAKAANAAALGFDAAGNRAPEAGSLEGIEGSYNKALEALRKTGSFPEQEAALWREFQASWLSVIEAAPELVDAVTNAGERTRRAGEDARETSGHYAHLAQQTNIVAGSFQNLYTQIGHASGYENSLRQMNDMLSEYGRAGVPVHGGLIPGAPHRAAGGPVSGGSTYWVGERGPELFTPGASGAITPAGGGPITVNVSGVLLSNDPGARAQLATVVQDALMTAYRRAGHRTPLYA